jgi:hypothetical protein
MPHRPVGIALALAAALLATGCAQPIKPYETLANTAQAKHDADMIVEGKVVATDDFSHLPQGEIWSNVLGKMGQACVIKTRITLDATQVLKGTGVKGPVYAWFYAPCFHAEPDVLMGVSLPAVLTEGDRLRIYLQNRQGEYWLIAHEKLPGSPKLPARRPPPPPTS